MIHNHYSYRDAANTQKVQHLGNIAVLFEKRYVKFP